MENNNEKIVYWSEIEKDIKKAQFKARVKTVFLEAKDKTVEALTYCKEHPGVVIAGITAATELTKVGLRVADRRDKIRAERTYYDHSSQQRMRTKKHLTDKQKMEAYNIHKETGMNYTDIYKNMGVL